MVDIVDLLDDSSDEEAEAPPKKDSPRNAPTNSTQNPEDSGPPLSANRGESSWLRDLVSNGYQTTATTTATTTTTTTTTTNDATTPAPLSNEKQDPSAARVTEREDSDDEVVWIPAAAPCTTPVANGGSTTSISKHSRAQQSPGATATDTRKPPPMPAVHKQSNDDDDDDDDEVMIVDPPPGASLSSSSSSRAKRPSSAKARTTNKSGRKRPLHPSSSIFQENDDDDDDDDDFLKYSRPSGLTRTNSATGVRCQAVVPNSHKSKQGSSNNAARPPDTPAAQHLTPSSSQERQQDQQHDYQFYDPYSGTPMSTKSIVANSNTGVRMNSAAKATESDTKHNPALQNPYAKRTSLPGMLSRTNSLGNQSVSSIGTATSVARLNHRSHSAGGSLICSAKTPMSTKRPILNPYSKNSGTKTTEPTTQSPSDDGACGVSYPVLRERTKLHADIRPNLILAMWKYARSNLTRDSFQRKRLDRYVGRIVDLAVTAHDFPIRSFGEYAFRRRTYVSKSGCGGVSTKDALLRLEEDVNSTGAMDLTFQVMGAGNKQYCSIAEACLVAMKDMIVRKWKNLREQTQQVASRFPVDADSQKTIFSQPIYFVSLVDLIPEIDRRLRPECPSKLGRKGETDHGAAYYTKGSTRSAEFYQVEKLMTPIDVPMADGSLQVTTYLKKRSVRGQLHYELTPKGFERAVIISRRVFPAPIGHYRSSNLPRVLPKFDKICLAVDLREGGAGDKYRKVLHEMCNKLDMQHIPYFVNTLKIGDYCFFSGDKLCPILVERKSVQDVAMSLDIDDGRWKTQKHRMYQGQFVFGYDNCRMAYIIEGKVEKHLVSNGFIGNARHKVSKERFDEEITNLEGEGFEVLRTCSVENSMFELARWAESVAKDVRSGRLKPKLTYNEFIEQVQKIPKSTDFSRLAAYHAQQSKNKDDQVVNLLSDDDDENYDLDNTHPGQNLRPVDLDERFGKTTAATASTNNNTCSNSRERTQSSAKRPSSSSSKVNTTVNSRAGALKRFKLDDREELIKEVRGRSFEYTSPTVQAVVENGDIPVRKTEAEESVGPTKTEYSKWTLSSLREKCVELGMKKTGNKAELVERLLDPSNRPPEVYRLRQQRGLYIPANLDTGATAILVAIQIQQDAAPSGIYNFAGGTKEELYALAEAIDIKKDPFSGGTTQTGPYHYDGWSSMSKLKESGDPPLVIEKKRRFRLSTTGDVSGLKLARAMHIWSHKKGICKCMELGHAYQPEQWKSF